jgi:hypothetical protein
MDALEKAVAARDEFLKANPHLQKYQAEIESVLDRVPYGQRSEVLAMLICGKMEALARNMNMLGHMLRKALP